MSADATNHLPSDAEFILFQRLILNNLGINLPIQKKALLSNRLWKRLQACGVNRFDEYYQILIGLNGKDELTIALELITTNETYFFREQKHFEYLRDEILPAHRGGEPLSVWSAAASTGEEPYSIAMLLRDRCLGPWTLCCSDVNATVLEHARMGIYSELRTRNIPDNYLRRFCRKGVGPQAGNIRVAEELRELVDFFTLNLHEDFPADIGKFDLIFLRNVLIYFENDIKSKVLSRIAQQLKPKGILFVGHSESLHGLSQHFIPLRPAVYRLADR
jgi:chemotaxis protein methyltransferase CheR